MTKPKAKSKKTQTRPYDAAAYLKSEKDCALYLQAAIDESDGDPAIIVTALGDIARARGMMQLARRILRQRIRRPATVK